MANGTKTPSVITSWRIFNCASESERNPFRLAGTCSRYSNSAMPQLTRAAIYQGRSARLRRCAYQANVMNTFDTTRRQTVSSGLESIGTLADRTGCEGLHQDADDVRSRDDERLFGLE